MKDELPRFLYRGISHEREKELGDPLCPKQVGGPEIGSATQNGTGMPPDRSGRGYFRDTSRAATAANLNNVHVAGGVTSRIAFTKDVVMAWRYATRGGKKAGRILKVDTQKVRSEGFAIEKSQDENTPFPEDQEFVVYSPDGRCLPAIVIQHQINTKPGERPEKPNYFGSLADSTGGQRQMRFACSRMLIVPFAIYSLLRSLSLQASRLPPARYKNVPSCFPSLWLTLPV